jgi:hypothetical protein
MSSVARHADHGTRTTAQPCQAWQTSCDSTDEQADEAPVAAPAHHHGIYLLSRAP